MPIEVQVACCQIAPDVDRPARGAALAREAIAAAVAGGAPIVVLPELVNTGYGFDSLDVGYYSFVTSDAEAERLAADEPARDELLQRLMSERVAA